MSISIQTVIPCADYQAARCRSCRWLELDYPQQLAHKTEHLRQQLAPVLMARPADTQSEWLPPVPSALNAFRNRAKMVVSGSAEQPVLGIIDEQGAGVDLQHCPLYPSALLPVFAELTEFIRTLKLQPYDLASRRGELKYLLINRSQHDGGLMLRFVLRSQAHLDLIRKHLPALLARIPSLQVVSVNLQPVHMAVLEGEQEFILTEAVALRDQLNDVPLYLQPKSFFQTNPDIAAKLYATARAWSASLPLRTVWDLFCGVGGFGLHCAKLGVVLTGIEIEPEAIACAQRSAAELGLTDVHFAALDAAGWIAAEQQPPDLLLMNPPRRGVGSAICQWLQRLGPTHLIYSSCNAESLARDLAMLPDYRLVRVQWFDMFPHTAHYETLVQLQRR